MDKVWIHTTTASHDFNPPQIVHIHHRHRSAQARLFPGPNTMVRS